VTLPLLSPVILIVTLLRVISSLKMFDQVVTLTGGGPGRSTQTLNYYIYQVGFRNLDMGYASALAIVLVLSLSLFAFAYVRLLIGKRA
jgi:multiple sugar transport system permease protein